VSRLLAVLDATLTHCVPPHLGDVRELRDALAELLAADHAYSEAIAAMFLAMGEGRAWSELSTMQTASARRARALGAFK
jgi:hypothetical protein